MSKHRPIPSSMIANGIQEKIKGPLKVSEARASCYRAGNVAGPRKIVTFLFFTIFFARSILFPIPSFCKETKNGVNQIENVIILVIDGLRNEEAFDDPQHRYIPLIWNELAPQGTICSRIYNTTWPVTTTGHLNMVTGNQSITPLSEGSYSGNSREHYPTIFEVYRKTFGLLPRETWIVSGKNQLSTCDYSLHPFWGESYKARSQISVGNTDRDTMERFYEVMENDQPSIALLNLKEVDNTGHQGSWQDYIDTIMRADTLAWELWETIQADSHYVDKTLLFVTTDHGRSATNFHLHGGQTHSNRHCMFLAIGPGIRKGAVDTTRGGLIDFASTVAYVFGLDMPFSEGRVLEGIFEEGTVEHEVADVVAVEPQERLLSGMGGASLFPSIASDPEGLYVVWTDMDTTSIPEKRLLLFTQSTDWGDSWTEPDTILDTYPFIETDLPSGKSGAFGSLDEGGSFDPGGGMVLSIDGTPHAVEIKAKGGKLTIGLSGYSILSLPGFDELLWSVNVMVRDGAGPWKISSYENSGRFVTITPAIDVDGGNIWNVWTEGLKKLFVGRSCFEEEKESRELLASQFRYHGYRNPTVACENGSLYLACEYLSRMDGRILFINCDTATKTILSVSLLDSSSTPSIDPVIAQSTGIIHLVWADLVDNIWQVKYVRSHNAGIGFSKPIQLSSGEAGSWSPDIDAERYRAALVWEDYRDSAGEIYATFSTDGGLTWSSEMRITNAGALACRPSVTIEGGRAFVVWQDYRSGSWEIIFREVPFPTSPPSSP